MKIVFLGTNGFAPTEQAHTMCCMIPELGIVLDAGTGCFRVGQYQQTDSIVIYLSHAHSDHTFGLTYLFSGYMKQVVSQAKRDHRTDDFEAIIDATNDMMSRVTVCSVESVLTATKTQFSNLKINWKNLEENHGLPENGKLSHFSLNHTTECYGFRLEWPDRSLAYVTDTIADKDADYVQHIKGVDVLIHDCYLPDSWAEFAHRTGHSHTSAVAQVAAQAQVGRLVLAHHNTAGLDIDLATAQAIFPQTVSAYDLMEISF